MSGLFFKGTSVDQDARWGDKEKKLMSQMTFPPEYKLEVDLKKVTLSVMKPWISQRVIELMGFEDEVVIDLVYNMLENNTTKPDPRKLQIDLTGFLARNAKVFVAELWKLLHSATNNPAGVPQQFLEQKKEEMMLKKIMKDKIEAELKKRHEQQALAAAAASQPVKSEPDGTGRRSRFGPKLDASAPVASATSVEIPVPPGAPTALNDRGSRIASAQTRSGSRDRGVRSRSRSRGRSRRDRSRSRSSGRRSRRSPSSRRERERSRSRDSRRRRNRSASRSTRRGSDRRSRERRSRSIRRDERASSPPFRGNANLDLEDMPGAPSSRGRFSERAENERRSPSAERPRRLSEDFDKPNEQALREKALESMRVRREVSNE